MLYHFYKKSFHRINLFIQNLLIYSERQKYGINSLKIKYSSSTLDFPRQGQII
jgi:hypothetical protein